MDPTERLLDLLTLLLHSREPVSFTELRELLPEAYSGAREAAERKFERDKDELRKELGVEIELVEPDDEREVAGYRIDRRSFFLKDPSLAPEEAAALYAAGSAALSAGATPFAQDLANALRKLSLSGPAEVAQAGREGARRLLLLRGEGHGDPQVLNQLASAAARRKRVSIRYRAAPVPGAPEPTPTEREVDPYGLAYREGSWRLLGHCHLRAAQRTFLVGRIEALSVNAKRPAQPDFEVPEGFDPRTAVSQRPWEWPGGEPREVELTFAPGCESLAERIFGQPAGARCTLQVRRMEGLLSALLPVGDRAWVTTPGPARDAVVAALQAVLARQQGETPLEAPPSPPQASASPVGASESAEVGSRRERLKRALLIVPAARRRPNIPLSELAAELMVSPEQLREDIDLLSRVGLPPFAPDDLIEISVDERDRVRVDLPKSFDKPPQLTALEALALWSAASELSAAVPTVQRALERLAAQLPPAARAMHQELARRIRAEPEVAPAQATLLHELRTAAELRHELRLAYDKQDRGDAQERIVWPLAILSQAGRWYALARDPVQAGERLFRLDRIRKAERTGQHFAPIAVDPARLRDPFSAAQDQAVLRCQASSAAWANQRFGGRARPGPSGSVEVVLDYGSPAYATALCLSLAGQAALVWPPQAGEQLRSEVARALSRYA